MHALMPPLPHYAGTVALHALLRTKSTSTFAFTALPLLPAFLLPAADCASPCTFCTASTSLHFCTFSALCFCILHFYTAWHHCTTTSLMQHAFCLPAFPAYTPLSHFLHAACHYCFSIFTAPHHSVPVLSILNCAITIELPTEPFLPPFGLFRNMEHVGLEVVWVVWVGTYVVDGACSCLKLYHCMFILYM